MHIVFTVHILCRPVVTSPRFEKSFASGAIPIDFESLDRDIVRYALA